MFVLGWSLFSAASPGSGRLKRPWSHPGGQNSSAPPPETRDLGWGAAHGRVLASRVTGCSVQRSPHICSLFVTGKGEDRGKDGALASAPDHHSPRERSVQLRGNEASFPGALRTSLMAGYEREGPEFF